MTAAPAIAPTRPVLRYHGGKWRLASWIVSHFPEHRVYVEPFGGAASVLLKKPRSYAEVYNDLDGEIVNVFRVLRNPAAAARLTTLLDLTPFSRVDYTESYTPSDDSIEQARRTIARSFMGFGSNALHHSVKSGFRGAVKRSGTTPAHDWRNLPPVVAAWVERLRGVTIEQREASWVLDAHDSPETLFYVDPPYVHEARRGRHGYRHELTDDDHRRLLTQLRGLAGGVILSGYRTPLYREMLTGWRRVTRRARDDRAASRTEVLWIKRSGAM